MSHLTMFGVTLAYLWVFWAVYVLVMGIYRAHISKRLGPVTFCLSLPFVAVGLMMDAFANLTIAALVFLRIPAGIARLQRYVGQGSGWRFTIANWICNNLLDVFDPSGNHC